MGSNHGTLMNGASCVLGQVGQAFNLDGADDYVYIPDSPSLQSLGNHFTLEAWVYPESLPAGDIYYDSAIVVREDYVRGFTLATRGNKLVMWIGLGHGTGEVAASDPIFPNAWYHVVGSYDGAEARIYVNGVLEDAQPASLAPINLRMDIGSARGGLRHFDGLIDEVTLWDRTLTEAQVLTLYTAGSAGKCRPCVPLPDGALSCWSGDLHPLDLVDSNHGVLTNGVGYALGKVDQAFSFDGLDDTVYVPDSASLQGLGDHFSIEAWIYPESLPGGDSFYDSSPGPGDHPPGSQPHPRCHGPLPGDIQ